jgi:hypothetical protein
MGYVMPYTNCATLFKCRTKGAAGGAPSIDFAPLRHLRHLVVQQTGGGGATACHPKHTRAAPSSGGATAGWRLRLADHAAHLLATPNRSPSRPIGTRAAPITARSCPEAHLADTVVMQPHRTDRPLISSATPGNTGRIASRQGKGNGELMGKQVLGEPDDASGIPVDGGPALGIPITAPRRPAREDSRVDWCQVREPYQTTMVAIAVAQPQSRKQKASGRRGLADHRHRFGNPVRILNACSTDESDCLQRAFASSRKSHSIRAALSDQSR